MRLLQYDGREKLDESRRVDSGGNRFGKTKQQKYLAVELRTFIVLFAIYYVYNVLLKYTSWSIETGNTGQSGCCPSADRYGSPVLGGGSFFYSSPGRRPYHIYIIIVPICHCHHHTTYSYVLVSRSTAVVPPPVRTRYTSKSVPEEGTTAAQICWAAE